MDMNIGSRTMYKLNKQQMDFIKEEIKKKYIIPDIKETVRIIGEKIFEDVMYACPIDKGLLWEELKSNGLQFTEENDKYGFMIQVDEARVPYAWIVEYGTFSMIHAHGPHNPKNPVRRWKAKSDHGRNPNATLPFIRASFYKNEPFVNTYLARKFGPGTVKFRFSELKDTDIHSVLV